MNMKHERKDPYHVRLLLLPSWFGLPPHMEIVGRETNSVTVLSLHLVYQSSFQLKFLPPDSSVGRSQTFGRTLFTLIFLSGFIQPLT